jgi:Tfp pilus assembly protein PilF
MCWEVRNLSSGAAAFIAATTLLMGTTAFAAPYRPAADDVVLERLPPALLAVRSLRGATPRGGAPVDLDQALASARRYIEVGQTYADPRAFGYAETALGSWWKAKEGATPELHVTRARILQYRHQYPEANAELKAALDADAYQPDAWLQFASIEQVQGHLDAARAGCLKLVPIADPLIGATCVASTGSLSGRSAAADQLLTRALSQPSAADGSVRAWAWTTLAEIRARRGDPAGAEFAFLKALELEANDVYARAAYADLLLDHGRDVDARRVLGDAAQADALLLRAAIAAQRNHDADAAALAANLSERFAEAHARNDETHLREQARYLLEVGLDPRAALALAQRNFAVQKEPADARILLESAFAAGDVDAAKPALDWIAKTRIDALALVALSGKLAGGGKE